MVQNIQVIHLPCFYAEKMFPKLAARRRQLRYWPPFSKGGAQNLLPKLEDVETY
jgi:hypothetical protein